MTTSDRRNVGERGQVTIPDDLRDRFGIEAGDDVMIHEEAGKLVIARSVTRDELAGGYRDLRRLMTETEGQLPVAGGNTLVTSVGR